MQPEQRVQQGGHVRQSVGGEAVQVSGQDRMLNVHPLQRWTHSCRQEQTIQGETKFKLVFCKEH